VTARLALVLDRAQLVLDLDGTSERPSGAALAGGFEAGNRGRRHRESDGCSIDEEFDSGTPAVAEVKDLMLETADA
jgi:hypothetical protein